MDHSHVEEHDLIEAYLADRLSESDRDAFEAHYFDCETCLERLETANGFREGMLQVAAEDLAQTTAARAKLGLLAGLAALSRRHRLALAGVFLLLVAIPCLWLAQRNRDLQRQLAATSARAEQQRAALDARLRELTQTTDRRAEAHPEVNVLLFTLAAVRGGEEAGREPVNQIQLPATGSVVLSLELATVDAATYRASLQAADGKEIWQGRDLRPDSHDTLVLLFPAGILQPGLYRLTVEGVKSDGKWFTVAAYPFRAARHP